MYTDIKTIRPLFRAVLLNQILTIQWNFYIYKNRIHDANGSIINWGKVGQHNGL